MPITGPSALVPTIKEFLAHWKLVEDTMPAYGPLTVLDGFGRGDLGALYATLGADPLDVITASAMERLAAQALRAARTALNHGMNSFNTWVRADFPKCKWERLLLRVPKLGDSLGKILPTMRETLVLWGRLEAAEPGVPFPQMEGEPYSRAHFAAAYGQLEAAWDAHTDAALDLDLARAHWRMIEERAVAAMKAYGHAVKARCGDGSRLTASLPQLWPGPSRGSRPTQ